MAAHPEASSGLGARESVKAHLLASQKLLVDSLYNVAPLLDSVLAANLLSFDNHQAIKAEKTPQEKARKLLEIVQCQLDEQEAWRFMECLRECKKHYPRLRTWLQTEPDISRGLTERQLQAQFSCLCNRLGSSVLPVSLALLSNSTLTLFDLEQIQAASTPTQQAQTLLSICLAKGETACRNFYSALNSEDSHLAEEINVSTVEQNLPLLTLNPGAVATPVEESRDTAGGDEPYSGLLQQMRAQLGVTARDEVRLNVCELGVAVGLQRRTVRDCLLEEVNIEDAAQLEVLVATFMEKTQDADRLLSRTKDVKIQRLQLSERGCLLLKLLQLAETRLLSESPGHLDNSRYMYSQDDPSIAWTIFRFLLCDCVAEAVEEPDLKYGGTLSELLQQLHGCVRVEPVLLQELEQCWSEGGTENLLQSIRVLAQILRDLHPLEDRLCISKPVHGLYSCRPGRLHRVTSFQGVPARVIRKALSRVASASQDTTPRAQQYKLLCENVAWLLEPERGKDPPNEPDSNVTQHVCQILSRPHFNSQAFDAGLHLRLLLVTEFNPAQLGLGLLMQLHQETLADLQRYLPANDHHNFQFVLESVQMLGQGRLLSVNRTRRLIAIDNGFEEVFTFKTSDPASFLVRLHCIGYEGKGWFQVRTPHCALASKFGEEGLQAVCQLGTVLAKKDNNLWIREGESRWWEKLILTAKRHSGQIQDYGCCFKVTTSETECEVRFIYRDEKLQATAERDCEVL